MDGMTTPADHDPSQMAAEFAGEETYGPDTMRSMGKLIYGCRSEYEFDDRLLAHLKVAVTAKLRRQECFMLSWAIDARDASGRMSLWLAPAIPLQFKFAGSRRPTLNRAWIDVMVQFSNSARGLVVISEADALSLSRGEIDAASLQLEP